MYTESDGLASTAVSGIGQDAGGRMLFLTRSAISRFDGVHWDPLDCGLRIADAYHHGLLTAPDGSVWTADGGDQLRLFVLDRDDCWWQAPPAPVAPVQTIVPTALTAIPDAFPPIVAIGTSTGEIAIWNGEHWQVVALGGPGGSDAIRGLAGRPDGRLVAATRRGLVMVDVATGAAAPWRPLGLPEGDIHALAADPDDDSALWVLGASWLARATDLRVEVAPVAPTIREDAAPAIIQPDGLGSVVVVSGMSAWLVDLPTSEVVVLDTTTGLGSLGVAAVFLDDERNLWFGGGRGVTRIGDRRIVSFTREHGLLEDEVTAILATSRGELVLGHPTGLSVMADSQVRRTVALPPGSVRRVMDLAEDHDGAIWIADARGGLLRLGRDGRLEAIPLDPAIVEVYSVALDTELGLVAGTDRGLVAVDASGARTVGLPLEIEIARRLVADAAGRLAIATPGNGLVFRDHGSWRSATCPVEAEANQVYTVTGSDPVWVGTRAGLFWNDGGVLRRPVEPRLELRRPVFMLLEDRQRRLWIGTDNGLFRWDGHELARFSTSTGLAGNELNRAAAHEDATGRLWFGTDRGLSCYRPRFDSFEPPPPRVAGIWLDAGDGPVPLERPVTLPAETSTVSFTLHTLSWVDERAIEVRSRLGGVDINWRESPAASQSVRYSNLPPGRYRLEVQTRNPTRPWSAVVRSPEITILAPIWRRPWFKALVGLSVIGGIAAVVGAANSRRRAALTDAVTGELNHEGLRVQLARRLRRPGRGRFGLLVARVDRFEAVVASLGHAQGDALLAQAASRLRERLPGCEIGRLEGSTFGVLLDPGAGRAGDSPVRDVQTLLAQPYHVDGHEVVSSVTCGVVADLAHDAVPEHVLRDAVAALRHAADEGSGSRRVFRPEIREQALLDLQLEADLRQALDSDQLALEFQPILDAAGAEMLGLEALLRWHHPRLGQLLPERFLGVAESTGLVVPLGGWVLHHALEIYADLGRSQRAVREAVLHVNLHPHQLGRGDIVAEARAELERSGVPPRLLSFELTEQALMRHPQQAAAALTELRAMGVGLCLDDFGTGHSSLALLQRFPVDTLKVDRSFVADLGSTQGRAVVAAITGLARSLHLQVIAEGVETEDQISALRGLGCGGFQGFLLAHPMTPPRLLEWLAEAAGTAATTR